MYLSLSLPLSPSFSHFEYVCIYIHICAYINIKCICACLYLNWSIGNYLNICMQLNWNAARTNFKLHFEFDNPPRPLLFPHPLVVCTTVKTTTTTKTTADTNCKLCIYPHYEHYNYRVRICRNFHNYIKLKTMYFNHSHIS